MLESAGLIVREEHPASKAKIFYRLTNQGIDLLPVLVEIILWSDKYLSISDQAREFAKMLKNNKAGVIKQMSDNLR